MKDKMDMTLHLAIVLLIAILILVEILPMPEILSWPAIVQQETATGSETVGELWDAYLSTASFSNLESFRFINCSIQNGDLNFEQSKNINFTDSTIQNMWIKLESTHLRFDYCYITNVSFTGDKDSCIYIEENIFDGNIIVDNIQIIFGGYNEFTGKFTVEKWEE